MFNVRYANADRSNGLFGSQRECAMQWLSWTWQSGFFMARGEIVISYKVKKKKPHNGATVATRKAEQSVSLRG